MKLKNLLLLLALFSLLAVSLACGAFSGAEPNSMPGPAAPPQGEAPPKGEAPPQVSNGSSGIGPITFAEDVSDYGDLINPGSFFPAGTNPVYAYFEYWGMTDGQSWGYYLTLDGYEYIDATSEVWEDGEEGWVAYYFEDLEPGAYELSLYVGGQLVQSAPLTIGQAQTNNDGGITTGEGMAAFGSIQFATGVTDDLIPIRPAFTFDFGVTEIYAIFPYFNMTDGTDWQREWLFNGAYDAGSDLVWDEGVEGWSYASFGYDDEITPLDAGDYTLNLYIDGQLARSANFTILGDQAAPEPVGPANPEDIIDPNLMQAWEILAYANPEILRDVAQFALDYHIEMVLTDEISAKGTYRCTEGSDEPGTLYIGQDFWNGASWEEVAATMAHELTHAVQHIDGGRCYCSIENEYYAYVTEFYVLQETGRMDLLETKWRGAYDDDGRFDSNALWQAVKDAYPECPDY